MKHKTTAADMLISFCICTTLICLLQGVMGVLFFPEMQLGAGAYFGPPLFGFLSVLLGMVTYSSKELTIRQVMARRAIHLALIEGMIFGLNYLAGNVFSVLLSIILAVAIAAVYILVYVILWIDDLRSAWAFNEKLKEFQEREKMTAESIT